MNQKRLFHDDFCPIRKRAVALSEILRVEIGAVKQIAVPRRLAQMRESHPADCRALDDFPVIEAVGKLGCEKIFLLGKGEESRSR